MRVIFRADASLQIGSGHVMRCLTLAEGLRANGAQCHFVSRMHPGHFLNIIHEHGFAVTALCADSLATNTNVASVGLNDLVHAPWLGCSWQTDAEQTRETLAAFQPDWLVVDHYALDRRWETALRSHYRKLMVIDDLADRPHQCDLLLDQNLGRQAQDYANLVPAHTTILTGPQYSLLRPEFAALRDYSMQRRKEPVLKQILITMGGVDQPNATGQVLQALRGCSLPQDCRISVVLGLHAPRLSEVRAQAQNMPWPTEVVINISDMAQRMADSDFAIGAAGSTSWERCCLGLPTLMVVLANNQWPSAKAMVATQAAALIENISEISVQLPFVLNMITQGAQLKAMSISASALTDGGGTEKILRTIEVLNG